MFDHSSSFIYIIIWYSVPKGYDVWENEVTDVLVITLQGYIKFFKSKLLFGKCFILDMYWSISLFQTQVRNIAPTKLKMASNAVLV